MSDAPAIRVEGLRIERADGVAIVDGVSFAVAPGEVLGIVGESGSGKTTTALALLGHAGRGLRIAAGTVEAGGQRVTGDRALRGRVISYVPQDPGSALDPTLRVGSALEHMLRAHRPERLTPAAIAAALEGASLPADATFRRRYPHQLSGGQQQRCAIAVALVCEPPVMILDEPTTGLDVVTQARILDEIDRLRRERGVAMVYVSHDLGVVARIADRVAVMYAGRIVEEGPTAAVLQRPRHAYTRGLVASIPDHGAPRRLRGMAGVGAAPGESPDGCAFVPRCPLAVPACSASVPPLAEVEPGRRSACLRAAEVPAPDVAEARAIAPTGGASLLVVDDLVARHGATTVVHGISFAIGRGECVALVGESGSGKTTTARAIAGLHEPAAGRITLDGDDLAGRARRRTPAQRRRIQIVFQNPTDALHPRQRVIDQVARPARVLRGLDGRAARAEATRLMELVRLSDRLYERFPRELSGGERQRVGIARALAAGPDLVICDEITSALDVSVQASVLELLVELQGALDVALLLITHDLGVVASVADRVLVLEAGQIREEGRVDKVLEMPEHPYTRRLLDAAPSLSAAVAGSG